MRFDAIRDECKPQTSKRRSNGMVGKRLKLGLCFLVLPIEVDCLTIVLTRFAVSFPRFPGGEKSVEVLVRNGGCRTPTWAVIAPFTPTVRLGLGFQFVILFRWVDLIAGLNLAKWWRQFAGLAARFYHALCVVTCKRKERKNLVN
jgi:hypothetical protein